MRRASPEPDRDVARMLTSSGLGRRELPALMPGEVLARLRCALVTGGKADLIARGTPVALVADVLEVGESTPFCFGQRIFPALRVPCGYCAPCQAGSPTGCLNWEQTAFIPAALADRFIVPAWNVRRGSLLLPMDISPEAEAFLVPLARIERVLSRLHASPRNITIVGDGLPAELWGLWLEARHLGSRRLLQGTVRDAAGMGYHETVMEFGEDPELIVLLDGKGALLNRALAALVPGGSVILADESLGAVTFDAGRCAREEKMLIYAHQSAPCDWEAVLRPLPRVAERLVGLIEARWTLEEWASLPEEQARGVMLIGS